MDNPLVSIVLINHNGETWLPEALRSCETQTYRNLEFILVDDCSADSSLQILNDFASRVSSVHVISTEHNLGISGARNLGLANASGEFVAFLDSDDLYLPETISSDILDFSRLSKTKPDLALLMTDAWIISEKGKVAGRYMPKKYWGRDIVDHAPNWTLPSTWFIRKRLASQFFAPYRFGEAAFYVEHVRRRYGVAFVGRPGIRYRLRMHSATNDDAQLLLMAIRATKQTVEQGRLDNPVPLDEIQAPSRREVSAWRHGRTAKSAFVNGKFGSAIWHGSLAAIANFPRFCKRAWRVVRHRLRET